MNKLFNVAWGLVILTVFLSCNDSSKDQGDVSLDFEMDLMPEGIALDEKRNCIYLNSLKHNKIVSYNLITQEHKEVIKNGEYGYLSGFGMIVKNDTLYALGNSLQQHDKRSILLMMDLNSGALIDSYILTDSSKIYLNDLVVSPDNIIYITDSESNRIFKIERPHSEFEVFLDSELVSHSNGISLSEDGSKLYLASNKGIGIVDTKSKRILNSLNADFAGNDGLKYKDGYLLGLVNVWQSDPSKNGLFKYSLNQAGDAIIDKTRMLSFDESFKVPTTFDTRGDEVFFIKNTQIDNFEEETNEILDREKLEPYVLMNFKIPTEK